MKKLLSALIILLTAGSINTPSVYAGLRLEPPRGKTVDSSQDLFDSLYNSLGDLVAPAYGWAIDLFTIMFVGATIIMILSIMMKNGQWQKIAQTTMFITFILMILLRGAPIIVLSINSSEDIDLLLSSSVLALGTMAFFMAAISRPISQLFRFGYNLIEHQKYQRWSKNLISVAVLMTFLAIVIPWIFPQV